MRDRFWQGFIADFSGRFLGRLIRIPVIIGVMALIAWAIPGEEPREYPALMDARLDEFVHVTLGAVALIYVLIRLVFED